MHNPHVERRYVTRKRMERRTPEGQLLSVTNTRTVHYNDPYGGHGRPSSTLSQPYALPPPPMRQRSYSASPRPRYSSETLRKRSVEYVEPPFVRTEPAFETYSREDEYHKLQLVRPPPPAPSPRRRHEAVAWKREEADDHYESLDWNRPNRREQVYFGREELYGGSSLTTVLDRINEIRRSNGKRELLPCTRLAAQAGRWAEWIVQSGEFRRDINEKMCIWRGGHVSPAVVDHWYEEAVEFKTSNFINMDWLRTVGTGSAIWPERNQTVVVVIYD